MSTNERNLNHENGLHASELQKDNQGNAPQKQWDVRPEEKESDPRQQQLNREWEQSQKQQRQYAQEPGVGENDRNPSENQRNQDPTRRRDNWGEEE